MAKSDSQAADVAAVEAAAPNVLTAGPADASQKVLIASRKNYQIPMQILDDHGKVTTTIVPPHGRVRVYSHQLAFPLPAGLVKVAS